MKVLYKQVSPNSKGCVGNLHRDCRKYNKASRTLPASEKDLQIKCFHSKLGQKMLRDDNQIDRGYEELPTSSGEKTTEQVQTA